MRKFLTILIAISVLSLLISRAGEPYKEYKAYLEMALGDAYNLNTAQTIGVNNMQLYTMFSTTHGYSINSWFVGGGVGFYRSFRDGENIFPLYAAGRFTFKNVNMAPNLEIRAGIIYDPLWVRKVQAYSAISAGITVYKSLQAGLRLSMFSRPSRFFTANAALVLSYEFGK